MTSMRILLLIVLLTLPGWAQRERLLERFDQDGDGRLSASEREQAREWLRAFRTPIEPEVLPDLYRSTPGPLKMLTQERMLRDEARAKDLEVKISYPNSGGPYPLIVFSHGAFGSKNNYEPLVKHWVSYGYVVLQASHSDSLSLGQPQGRIGDVQDPHNFQDWANRPRDVKFLLDSLDLFQDVPIDGRRIGVGGHSYGAHTTQLLAGATTTGAQDHSDPRPQAFLLISPQGRGQLLSAESWKDIQRPLMVVTGSGDKVRTGEEPETRLDPYKLSAPGHKHLLWIEGASHNFGGISGRALKRTGGKNTRHVAYVVSATLAYWDAYLKNLAPAQAFLNEGHIPDSRLEHR